MNENIYKNGFTLIELMIALTLLTVAVFFISPLMVFSFSQVAQAGDMNSDLYRDIGELESNVGAGKISENVVNTGSIGVVFQNAGDSGTNVGGYAGGNVYADNDSDLKTFVGQIGFETAGIELSHYILLEQDIVDANILTIEITGRNLTFDDLSKFKMTNNDGSEVYVTGNSGFEINEVGNYSDPDNPVFAKATMTIPKDKMLSAYGPFKIYYGSYFQYVTVVESKIEITDLFAVGNDGYILSANNLTQAQKEGLKVGGDKTYENKPQPYIWVPQGQLTTANADTGANESNDLNDILWLEGNDSIEGRFVGLGDNGTFFEITNDDGLEVITKSGTMTETGVGNAGYKFANENSNFVEGAISPDDAGAISFVGTMSVNDTKEAGIYEYDFAKDSVSSGASSNLTTAAGPIQIGRHGALGDGINFPALPAYNAAYVFNPGHVASYYPSELPIIKTAEAIWNDQVIGGDDRVKNSELLFSNHGEEPMVNDVAIGALGSGNYGKTSSLTTLIATEANRLYFKNSKVTTFTPVEYSRWYSRTPSYRYYEPAFKDEGWHMFDDHWYYSDTFSRYAIGRFEVPDKIGDSQPLANVEYSGSEPLAVAYGKHGTNTGVFMVGYEDGRIFRIEDPSKFHDFNDGSYAINGRGVDIDTGLSVVETSGAYIFEQDLGTKINSIAYGADRWVAVGDNGSIWVRMHDSTEWKKVDISDTIVGYEYNESTGAQTELSTTGIQAALKKDTSSSSYVDFNKVVYVEEEYNNDKTGEFFIVGDNATFLHGVVGFDKNGWEDTTTWVLDEAYENYDVTNSLRDPILNKDNIILNSVSKIVE